MICSHRSWCEELSRLFILNPKSKLKAIEKRKPEVQDFKKRYRERKGIFIDFLVFAKETDKSLKRGRQAGSQWCVLLTGVQLLDTPVKPFLLGSWKQLDTEQQLD